MQGNPFSLPGRNDPRPALDPLAHKPDSDELYLDVDRTETSYRKFQAEFEHPGELGQHGRLVIVAGREQCGKTALINRCAGWIRDRLAEAGMSPAVLDLRSEVRPALSVPERTQMVCRRMMDQLRARAMLSNWSDFSTLHQTPEDMYANLGHYLDNNGVVVALLPPSELGEELVEYAHFSRTRLLFFCEIRDLGQLEVVRRRLVLPGDRRPTFLEVGPLEPEHGWTFVASRMATSGLVDKVPPLSETTLRRMTTERPISIGELQRLLYELYDEVLDQEPHPAEVTWDDVTSFYYRWADRRNHER